jgi:twitching motility protein PilJ
MTDARLPTVRRLDVLVGIAAVLVLAGAIAYIVPRFMAAAEDKPAQPTDVLYSLAVEAQGAVTGDEAALAGLQKQAERLQQTADAFGRDDRFARLTGNADLVLKARNALVDAGIAAREARDLVPRMLTEVGNLAGTLSGPTLEGAVRALERFELRAQRLQLDVSALAAGAADQSQAAQRLAESADYMGQVIQGLQGRNTGLGLPRVTGQDAEQRLSALNALYTELNTVVRQAVSVAPELPPAQAAARALVEDARALAEASAVTAPGGGNGIPWMSLGLTLAALLALVVLWRGVQQLRDITERQRFQADAQRKENERDQQAILRLLDELSSLADGDLTVQATVTEDITGAIADSINYAVDALRGLVTTINQSAIQLDAAARQTQALAQHLAKASGAQSKQIASATETAGAVAAATEEVSNNAERAADVARHSVDIAHKGGDAVRRTIDGMNTIRETIQETSKRIKRLGESSQEIGNIVELINDIAEQTNILALNASIQASMAGEAGRGFAVVADEVQRLAERAANATKQIEVLVRTIQTDTNEAVVSMERSTTDVVGGALLAENAGAALEEIEQVSNQIASLVQNISGSSRQQSAAVLNIARNMQVLKEISAQTADSTSATSVAIAKLAELSAGLRKAAAGFRLPGAPDNMGATGVFKRQDEGLNSVRPVSAVGSS